MQAPEPTIAERITEARGQVTKGEIDAPAFEHYRTSTAGTVAEVAGLLWQNELYLVDVDPTGAGIDKKADKKLVTDFKALLQARVARALTAKFGDLIKQVSTSGTKIGDQVEAILKESPMWAEGTVTDRLFVEWVGPVPVSGRSPQGTSDLWAALRRASESSVASKRADHLSKTAVKALDAAEVSAVKTLLNPSTDWVVTAEDTANLTDRADEHADPRGRVGHHQRDHPPIKEESSGAGVLGDLPEPVRRDSHQAHVDLLPGQHRRH